MVEDPDQTTTLLYLQHLAPFDLRGDRRGLAMPISLDLRAANVASERW
jgi:hypothetical protein